MATSNPSAPSPKRSKAPASPPSPAARPADIEAAARAIEPAHHNRIHVFLASSDLHLEAKLRITRDQALEQAAESITHALRYTDNVEFSAEDATRSDPNFLLKLVIHAVSAGATTINLPDTVGYTTPDEYKALFAAHEGRGPQL